jgi:hypothetical protein
VHAHVVGGAPPKKAPRAPHTTCEKKRRSSASCAGISRGAADSRTHASASASANAASSIGATARSAERPAVMTGTHSRCLSNCITAPSAASSVT